MEEYLSYAENPEREFRTLQKMIRDWKDRKKKNLADYFVK